MEFHTGQQKIEDPVFFLLGKDGALCLRVVSTHAAWYSPAAHSRSPETGCPAGRDGQVFCGKELVLICYRCRRARPRFPRRRFRYPGRLPGRCGYLHSSCRPYRPLQPRRTWSLVPGTERGGGHVEAPGAEEGAGRAHQRAPEEEDVNQGAAAEHELQRSGHQIPRPESLHDTRQVALPAEGQGSLQAQGVRS